MKYKRWMELGRSMVEMLGVLAIIGVLSIVGIQGYKKAMNKFRANELMDIAMKTYNQALANAVVDQAAQEFGTFCSNSVPDGTTNAQDAARCNEHNMGLEKPSWATLDSFEVMVRLRPDNGKTLAKQVSHVIYLFGTGSCDICKEVEAMLEEKSGSTARRLPGSNSGTLSWGLGFYCYAGAEASMGAGQCFNQAP